VTSSSFVRKAPTLLPTYHTHELSVSLRNLSTSASPSTTHSPEHTLLLHKIFFFFYTYDARAAPTVTLRPQYTQPTTCSSVQPTPSALRIANIDAYRIAPHCAPCTYTCLQRQKTILLRRPGHEHGRGHRASLGTGTVSGFTRQVERVLLRCPGLAALVAPGSRSGSGQSGRCILGRPCALYLKRLCRASCRRSSSISRSLHHRRAYLRLLTFFCIVALCECTSSHLSHLHRGIAVDRSTQLSGRLD
jgi:hypothetical protein